MTSAKLIYDVHYVHGLVANLFSFGQLLQNKF